MGLLTLLPPLAAILVAVATRQVLVALLTGLFLSEFLIAAGVGVDGIAEGFGGVGAAFVEGLLGTARRTLGVFESAGNAQILTFCLLIGILIAFMRDSGGVSATAQGLIRSGLARTPRRAELAVAGTGTAIFVETNVSLLSAGVLGRPLYDAHGMSRERLAYVVDSTSAPISVLVLLNAWGAYALALVAAEGITEPLPVVMGSIPLNFYAIVTVVGVYLTALSGHVFGPLASAEAATRAEAGSGETTAAPTKALYMWLPLVVMVGGALLLMVVTGGGAITEGDGALSILIAICVAILLAGVLLLANRVFSVGALARKSGGGMGEMIPLVSVLLLSLALGASVRELGTGLYVSQIAAGSLPPFAAAAVLFLAAALTSFTTGTSWGTYGILVPIAMPLAAALGIPPSLALAAVLGGGVFGDHCSPISDTTLIASVAAGTSLLAHVKTQLLYALAAAGLAIVLFLVAGLAVT